MTRSVFKRHKLLVANRSEIACRVFQTAREMGLQTVAIVAPGDEQARHLTFADEVVAVDGYLDVRSIINAACVSGATLVHPGYGFLSERPVFARAVEDAGLSFVGPRAETMAQMGGKIDAKQMAAQAGVPTLPWARVERGQDLAVAAQSVGYPLLLKAAAGGGGKGMRRVNSPAELESAAESASAEALAAFGDGTLFLERLLDRPRHVEVQVFGDGQGHVVHLHERDCSLQRRHQKIWEEAPAVGLSESTRRGLCEAALRLAQFVRYRSAGTLEFLVDSEGNFYFLEMNTRLQVEHPVTECVTGVDLVRAQLEQAIDPDRPALCDTPAVRGHAIEVRLYAEDPSQGFLPTPGTIQKLRWPLGAGIRVESGIEEGQTIGTAFDAMLGKLIVTAATRAHALERMRVALEDLVLLGSGSNQSYLQALCVHPAVWEGRIDTGFLEREFSFSPLPSAAQAALIAAACEQGWARLGPASVSFDRAQQIPSPWQVYGGVP